MISNIYTIYDNKAKECGDLITAKNDDVAIRMFQQAISKSPYPEDFQLLTVAHYDSETGNISDGDSVFKPVVVFPKEVIKE